MREGYVRPEDGRLLPLEGSKAAAAFRAAEAVRPGMVLGLGTGSTVAFFLEALAGRIRSGELPGVVGVPTSQRTEEEARRLGIPLTTLEQAGTLELAVDGADEVDPYLNLIKGMGGALLREKVVAQDSRKLLIVVDEGKIVPRLGTRSPLPVEVIPFGWTSHLPFLEDLGARPLLRRTADGEPFRSDNGHLILDCRFPGGIGDPRQVEKALAARAGIIETGLFLGMAQEVFVGGEEGVRILRRGEETLP